MMKRGVRQVGWVLAAGAAVVAFGWTPQFWRDLKRVLPAQLPFLVGEPLVEATNAPAWVTAAEGGHWTKRGWHLAPGERGWLRVALPGQAPGTLKLRLWAHDPGTLDASISSIQTTDVVPGFSRADTGTRLLPSFRGAPIDVVVKQPAVLDVQATNRTSADHLVLERLAAVFIPPLQRLPSLWSIAAAVLVLLAGCTTIIGSRYSPGTAASLAGIALAVAAAFALRWRLFDMARGLPLDPDTGEFVNYAREFAWLGDNRGVFSAAHPAREPLHVASLSVWLALFGPSPASARLMTLCMSTLLVAAVAGFVWSATGQQILAALAAWVAALNPVLIEESMRGLRTEAETMLLVATVLCWFQGRGWFGALLLGLTAGVSGLMRAAALTIVLPLAWIAWLLNAWSRRTREKGVRPLFRLGVHPKRGADPFFQPDQWTAPQLVVASLVAVSMSVSLIANLRYDSAASTRDRPYTTRQARIWANQEFPDKLGTPGFPTRDEFQRDPYAGPELSLGGYFFGLHSLGGLVRGQIKGWVESTSYMAASLAPGLRDLVVLKNASGLRAAWESAGTTTIIVCFVSLALTGLGWIALWRDHRLWWVPVVTVWGTWYVVYAYSVRLLELFRHTAHVYPFLVLALVWGITVAAVPARSKS